MTYPISLFDYNFDWAFQDIGMEEKPVPGYLAREDFISFCRSLDIAGVELMDPYWSEYSVEQLKRTFEQARLPVLTYGFMEDLIVPAREQQANFHNIDRLLVKAAGLGAAFAWIIPGQVKTTQWKAVQPELDQQREWLVQGLRKCAERAQSLGLTLVCENIDDPPLRALMGSGRECADICRRVDHPHFRLTYDMGAALAVDEDPVDTLLDMAPYLVHVHVKNFLDVSAPEQRQRYHRLSRSNAGAWYTGSLLENGVIDLRRVMDTLAGLSYRGGVMIEYQGEEDPRAAIRHNVDFLRKLMRERKERDGVDLFFDGI